MRFEFATASRIIFGPGRAREIPQMDVVRDRKVCLVTGSNPDRHKWLADALTGQGGTPFLVSVSGEPSTDLVALFAEQARARGCETVVAVGGGSVLDAGKALAALITNPGDVYDYLEVVGRGGPLVQRPVPLIAAPTTAGTGSEVTANAVLSSPEHRVKVSLRSAWMLPQVALVDPELSAAMPRSVTAATGMDALTQLVEAFVSRMAAPMTDALCRDGMARAARSLARACEDGASMEARSDMALAALYSGMALANAKLGAVHGLAAPLGGEFKARHGAVCAALLPEVMRANISALKEHDPGSRSLAAYGEVAAILTGRPDAAPEHGVDWVRELCETIGIRSLAEAGVDPAAFQDIAAKAAKASSMKGNPVELSPGELVDILQRAL